MLQAIAGRAVLRMVHLCADRHWGQVPGASVCMPTAQGDDAAQGSRLTDHPADAVSSPESGGEYVDGEFCDGEPGCGEPPD